MSWGDMCSHEIYHELIGTEKVADYNNVAFRVGKALEPMIVQMCADQGLDLYFTEMPGSAQLEIAHEDPYRTGHPDGAIVAISDLANITPWLFERLPGEALERLIRGETAVLEAKALNNTNYKIFAERGFDMRNTLMRKYYGQTQEYIHTLSDVKSDELWESGEFRAVLAKGIARPSWVLVCAYNKETSHFCFRVIEPDDEFFERSNARIHIEVIQEMDEGRIPKPSFNGREAECFWCPFKGKCPAFLGLSESETIDLDAIPTMAPPNPKMLGHLDDLAAQYRDISERESALRAEKSEIRDQILSAVDRGYQLYTEGYKVKHGTVKGRRGIDTVALSALAAKHGFEVPYKEGEPSSRVYVSSLALPTPDGDDS
jgi:hypothetical protein